MLDKSESTENIILQHVPFCRLSKIGNAYFVFLVKPTSVPNTEFIVYYSVKFQYIVGYNKWVFVTLL
jgi:hypothetical protein